MADVENGDCPVRVVAFDPLNLRAHLLIASIFFPIRLFIALGVSEKEYHTGDEDPIG